MRKRTLVIAATLVLFAGIAIAQNTANYRAQGGALWVIGSGGDLDIAGTWSVGGTDVATTAAQINAFDGGGVVDTVIACGQADESGTIYMGPATAAFGGDGSDASIGGTACDALDDATEGTADAPIVTNVAFKILGALCTTDGTLGAGETVVFSLRTAAAATVPAQTCTVSEAESDCSITTATTTDVAAGATIAVKAVQSGDNADDNLWCRLTIAYQ